MKYSWNGIALTALFVGGGIACLAFKESSIAMLLFGAAIGQHFPEPVRPKSRRGDAEGK